MALVVQRPKLTLAEKLYLPAIVAGLAITLKHFKNLVAGKTKVTMQYPEEKWDSKLPSYYRGAPTLVQDEHGKDRCVACQLCEFICPPRAITITPMEIPAQDRWAKVEKRPREFEIDMIHEHIDRHDALLNVGHSQAGRIIARPQPQQGMGRQSLAQPADQFAFHEGSRLWSMWTRHPTAK